MRRRGDCSPQDRCVRGGIPRDNHFAPAFYRVVKRGVVAAPPAGVGGRRGVEVFFRPIGRERTRSAANPGDGRAACGTALAARKSRRSRRETCNDSSEDSIAREPPHTPGRDRRGTSRPARCGCGGSRAKLRECGPLAEATFRLPQAAKPSAPPAGGFAGDLGGGRGADAMPCSGLRGRFSGRNSGLRG